jgi:transcriptional regulator with XRE-family HTH domain
MSVPRRWVLRFRKSGLTLSEEVAALTGMMATPAAIEERGASHTRRGSARVRLNLNVTATSAGGEETPALVHDLSSSGLLIETAAKLSLGNKLVVALPEADDVEATIVWQSEALFGCRFDKPLGQAALGAAQLRNPIPRDLQLAEQSGPPQTRESLPQRLLRLRQERGLSRSEVAERTGVSPPSVWAWEVGKTTPREKHLFSLANALGIAESELRMRPQPWDPNSDNQIRSSEKMDPASGPKHLQSMLESKRVEIATLFDVTVDKVKIIVEF